MRAAFDKAAQICGRLGRMCYTSPMERRTVPWFAANGDQTLRLDYNLDESSVVFDLGGYEGQWASEIFARYCCSIHVFEPVAAFAGNIERRFAKNKHITVHRFGLAEARKTVQIAINVTILQGDSRKRLPQILAQTTQRCLFWLDGHYSGGVTARGAQVTPILNELDAIFKHPVQDHVVLIDDARNFTPANDHPTLNALREYVFARRPDLSFSVEDDIIRLLPRSD